MNNHKKILHFITSINRGGAELQMLNLVCNDKKNKHIIISLINSNELLNKLQLSKIDVFSLNLNKNMINKFFFLFTLINLIIKIKPNKIYCWMYHSCLISILIKLIFYKKIYWLIRHGSPFRPYVSFRNYITNLLLAFFSNIIPYKIIYCSDYSISQHQKIGYNRKKSLLIYNGYKKEEFHVDKKKSTDFRKKNLIKDECFIIGMLARYHSVKNHKMLFESLSILKKKYQNFDFKIILAGRGINNNNKELINLLVQSSIFENSILLDQIDKTKNFYNILDLHILPSFNESFPNVICESLLCGVDCIATNVGASNEILPNKQWLLEDIDAEILASKINSYYNFYQNIKDKKEYSESLHKKIHDKYSITKFLDKYERIK